MSNWLAGIIGGVIGAALGGIVISCFALKAIRATEKKLHAAYKDGYTFGFKAGLRRGKALQRVDTAPGFDSIRDAKTTCPVVASYDISNAQIRNIFDTEPAQEVPHD